MLSRSLFVILCVGAAAIHPDKAAGFIRALEFKYQLRICNAYPYASAIEVHRSESEKLTKGLPMHYRTCKDFTTPLKPGDKLEFKVGDASAGTFAVSDLPNNDATLLLVLHRHDTLSTAVSFESHVFGKMQNAQVVIMDTYKGAAKSSLKIMDNAQTAKKGKSGRYEDLRYESVMAVQPGMYDVELVGSDGKATDKSDFVALNGETYVILRTGIEAQQGPSYPQELLIFPKSDILGLRSAASFSNVFMALVSVMLGSFLRWY